MTFAKGQPVKLTDRYAEVLCRSKKNKTDWVVRRGTVVRCSVNYVSIAWPGRKSIEQFPIKAVELA
jgi:hypothetical protein